MMQSPFVSRALYNATLLRAEKAEERYHELAERALELVYDQGILPRKTATPRAHPAAQSQAPRDDVPGGIWDAIEEMAPRPSDPLRARLMDYALEQRRRWGTEAAEIATEIRRGNSGDTFDDLDVEDEG